LARIFTPFPSLPFGIGGRNRNENPSLGVSYYLLEDPDLISRLRADPRAFLEETQGPAILDEIQNVPEILNYVRTRIDRSPTKKGQA